MFNYTAMGVGNHDFDDGPDGLLPFIKDCNFPILGANLNLEAFPDLDENISNSTIGKIKAYIFNIHILKQILCRKNWKNNPYQNL